MDDELEVTVSGITYRVRDLSAEAQGQVANLRFVEAQITELNSKLAVYQTARNAYQAALQQLIPHTRQ